MNDLPKYFKQANEWQEISKELQAKHPDGVTAYQVTLEQKKRCLARGEKFMEYQDIMDEYHEHNPMAAGLPEEVKVPSLLPGAPWLEINLHEFLARMTVRLPPPEGQRHTLCLTDDGHLQLILRVGGTSWEAFLLEPRTGQGSLEVVEEIMELRVKRPQPPVPTLPVTIRPPAGERHRRTDDGTYPDAGEQLAKLARRAAASKDPAVLQGLAEELKSMPPRMSVRSDEAPAHTCINTTTTVDGSSPPPCPACQLVNPLEKK